MKDALREVMSQFYADGVPSDVVARAGRFPEVRNNATIVKGMRRTGKTYFLPICACVNFLRLASRSSA